MEQVLKIMGVLLVGVIAVGIINAATKSTRETNMYRPDAKAQRRNTIAAVSAGLVAVAALIAILFLI